MKEIGEALKEARENASLSIEEVASDLKLRVSQVESIEEGNADAFKDIFYLKSLIKDYSKYIGLDYDDMIDEFNEYLFDHTSRISLDEIKKAKKKAMKKEKQNRVASPYTLDKKKSLSVKIIMCLIAILVIIFSLVYLINTFKKPKVEEPVSSIIK